MWVLDNKGRPQQFELKTNRRIANPAERVNLLHTSKQSPGGNPSIDSRQTLPPDYKNSLKQTSNQLPSSPSIQFSASDISLKKRILFNATWK